MQISEACDDFLHYCECVRKLSPHTVRAYGLDLKRFRTFIGDEADLRTFNHKLVQSYVEQLFGPHKLKPSSAKRHLASLRSMFRWLEGRELLDEDPFRRARIRIQTPRRLPRLLSRAELAALLRPPAVRPDFRSDLLGLTPRVAIELLFATGIRVGELTALRDEDIDLQSAVINVRGKGDRQRRVYVPDEEIRDLLQRYRQLREEAHPAAEMFLVTPRGTSASPRFVRAIVRRVASAAGIERRVTPHMFRHSLATYLLEEDVDIRYVQRLLGHRSISTTEIYTHVADAELKRRIKERHPRSRILSAQHGDAPGRNIR